LILVLVPIQIVCGAANVNAGQNAPVATIGTVLYDKEAVPLPLKKD
jgi:phenylalanyl-tRNA synthetase beta chain